MQIAINKHISDFREESTIEVNVKFPRTPSVDDLNYKMDCPYFKITDKELDEILNFELETGNFTNDYCQDWFNEIQDKTDNKFKDWSFAGRSNGWLVLLYDDVFDVTDNETLEIIDTLSKEYFEKYTEAISKWIILQFESINYNKERIIIREYLNTIKDFYYGNLIFNAKLEVSRKFNANIIIVDYNDKDYDVFIIAHETNNVARLKF